MAEARPVANLDILMPWAILIAGVSLGMGISLIERAQTLGRLRRQVEQEVSA